MVRWKSIFCVFPFIIVPLSRFLQCRLYSCSVTILVGNQHLLTTLLDRICLIFVCNRLGISNTLE